jgi:hypothetical protein
VEPGNARLAQQRLQVMVEVEAGTALGHQPFVPGNLSVAVKDDQVGGVQVDADLPAHQPDRHRVAVGANGDLAAAVDARPEPGAGLERLVRQRRQPRLLHGEHLPDGVGPAADAPVVVGGVPGVDHGVELLERIPLPGEVEDLGDRGPQVCRSGSCRSEPL